MASRAYCDVGTQLSWYERGKNAVRTHCNGSRLYQLCTSSMKTIRFIFRLYYVNVVPMSVLSPFCVLIGSSPRYVFFLSSTGRRPASLCHGLLSVVRPCVRSSVRALNFSLNIFFTETTYRILMKFHRNVPAMVLFRISCKHLIPSKTVVAMATKLKKK